MSIQIKRGKLIAIEGTDASGKETQSQMLFDRLTREEIPCKVFSFPQYETPTGKLIMRYLGKPPYGQEFGPAVDVPPRVASTWFATDRLLAAPEIKKYRDLGINLVLNRWVESNMGHQGAKIIDHSQRRELIDWIENLEYGDFKLPRSDAVVFLYMPHEVAAELRKGRGEKEDGHESDIEHLRNAEESYLELAVRFNWHRINCAPDGTMDSLKSREQISDEVYGIVKNILQNT